MAEEYEKLKIAIGKRIQEERRKIGLTQSQFAEKVGLSDGSRQSVRNWENGTTVPHLEDLCTMCAVFECDLSYLLCEHEYRTRSIQDIHEVTGLSKKAIEFLKGLNESSMRDLLITLSKILEHPESSQLLRSIHVHIWNYNNRRLQTEDINIDEVATYMNCKPDEVKKYLEQSSILLVQSIITDIVKQI